MIMTSRRGSSALLRAVLLITICHYANADLIVKPNNADAVVGGTTFFNCSTTLTSAEIHWFHYVVGDTKDRSFVYGYDQFYSRYLGRFRMEKIAETGSYNLIITSVTVDDAGRYECQDDSGRGDKDSAQLNVLDESPVCQSNIKPKGLVGPNISGIEPDTLHLTCAVQYHGNQPPLMQWREVQSGKVIVEGITHNASSDRAIYYLKMEVNSGMDGSSYQCATTRSTTSQYGCTSDVVRVKGFRGTVVVIISVLVSAAGGALLSAFACFKVGRNRRDHKMTEKGTTKNSNTHQSPSSKEPEEIKLIDIRDIETIDKLTAENKRLFAKVNEYEQMMFCSDNKVNKTAAKLAHTIVTKAEKKTNVSTPITGMTILDKNLFVVKKNNPVVEVYDSETFVFVRSVDNLNVKFMNLLDITSSKEDKLLYVINRENAESTTCSTIFKFNFAGEGGKMWGTEKDNGRLSAYESNLIVCFSTKRLIVEYTPEGETVNTVRLSPGSGFNNLRHAVKLTGTHFVVSHSKVEGGQRVCVVDVNGNVLAAFEELPTFFNKAYDPICLVWHRDEPVMVADARNKRVLLLSSKELAYEGARITVDNDYFPVRLCLNETKDRIFVGVNSGEYSKSETWKEGCVLIYNLSR